MIESPRCWTSTMHDAVKAFRSVQSLYPGEHRLTCPSCGRSPKDRTFGVTVEPGGAAVGHCFRCEHVESYRPDCMSMHRPGTAINRPVAAPKRETLSKYGLDLFAACTGLRGTAGGEYLLARGCVIPPVDGDLRFHPALKHPASDQIGPALVALVTHAVTRVPRTLHRTWIRADGRKADCDRPRMLLGGHEKEYGLIRLWPDETVTTGLGIAEGIETALSLAHAFTPVWSCIDAGNLAAFPLLEGIEALTVSADNDADGKGIASANACADRWAEAGREVRVVLPQVNDLNDLARAA